MKKSHRIYTHNDFEILGFHDCSIYGVEWNDARFEFSLSLDYITQWIDPVAPEKYYKFKVAPAKIIFQYASEVKINLIWGSAEWLKCEIDEFRKTESRKTPNGAIEWKWEFDLHEPNGSISLWATGFELQLLKEPILSKQRLRPTYEEISKSFDPDKGSIEIN